MTNLTLTFDVVEFTTKIRPQIITEYGMSILISWKMKRELGFTVRYHEAWIKDKYGDPRRTEQIKLDFYDEPSLTFFTLKYLNRDVNDLH